MRALYKSALLVGGLLLGSMAWAQKTQLLVYTALEVDQLKAYQEGFNKVYPDIELKWVRDSTGVITAKLLAEKANPQADAVMGVAATSLELMNKNGMLEPYAPLNLDAIMPQYRDKANPSLLWGRPSRWERPWLCWRWRGIQRQCPPRIRRWRPCCKA